MSMARSKKHVLLFMQRRSLPHREGQRTRGQSACVCDRLVIKNSNVPGQMERWSGRDADKCDWSQWLHPRPYLDIQRTSKICNSPITTSVYNKTTGIVASCTADGRVVFARLDSLESGNSSNLSSVQLMDGSLRCFIWPNNHEFLATGSGASLVLFNILNLRRTVIGDCHSTIQTLRQQSGIVYAGTQEGRIELYDARMSVSLIGSAAHVFRRTFHPVQDIAVSGDWIYSATARKGRLWLWDKRNLKNKLRILETDRHLCSVHVAEPSGEDGAVSGPLPYLLCGGSILRAGAGISIYETISIDDNGRTLPSSRLQHLLPHGLFLWNIKDGLCIWNGRETAICEHPELSGLEPAGLGRYILYTRDGQVSVATLAQNFT